MSSSSICDGSSPCQCPARDFVLVHEQLRDRREVPKEKRYKFPAYRYHNNPQCVKIKHIQVREIPLREARELQLEPCRACYNGKKQSVYSNELRALAINLWKKGKRPCEIYECLGETVNRRTIYNWIRDYRLKGKTAKDKMGPKLKTTVKMTPEILLWVQTICRQFGKQTMTLREISDLIYEKSNRQIQISPTTIYNHFKISNWSHKMTKLRPRAIFTPIVNDKRVQWCRKSTADYVFGKQMGMKLLCWDESNFSNKIWSGRKYGWSRKGEPVLALRPPAQIHQLALGALMTPLGALYIKSKKGAFKADELKDIFLFKVIIPLNDISVPRGQYVLEKHQDEKTPTSRGNYCERPDRDDNRVVILLDNLKAHYAALKRLQAQFSNPEATTWKWKGEGLDEDMRSDRCAADVLTQHDVVKEQYGRNHEFSIYRFGVVEFRFLPPYSSFLNPIEYVFHMIKSRVRRARCRSMRDCIRSIQNAVDSLPPVQVSNCFHNSLNLATACLENQGDVAHFPKQLRLFVLMVCAYIVKGEGESREPLPNHPYDEYGDLDENNANREYPPFPQGQERYHRLQIEYFENHPEDTENDFQCDESDPTSIQIPFRDDELLDLDCVHSNEQQAVNQILDGESELVSKDYSHLNLVDQSESHESDESDESDESHELQEHDPELIDEKNETEPQNRTGRFTYHFRSQINPPKRYESSDSE